MLNYKWKLSISPSLMKNTTDGLGPVIEEVWKAHAMGCEPAQQQSSFLVYAYRRWWSQQQGLPSFPSTFTYIICNSKRAPCAWLHPLQRMWLENLQSEKRAPPSSLQLPWRLGDFRDVTYPPWLLLLQTGYHRTFKICIYSIPLGY